MSEAVETNPIEDLINHSLNQDYNKANQVFGDILGKKLDVALEQEKIRMADLVYNGTDPDEEDLDDEDLDDTETGDDDQLEFDLESDDIEGTEEDGAVEDSEEDGIDDQGEDDPEEDEV